jgi:hypothetical protein
MTYKNVKFEESLVMRSLEALAVKKGLISNDPVVKQASKVEPLVKDLNQKIMKLCSGLRQEGLTSYANELESKFLLLKKAENILDEAHPDGSVDLKDMEGDATIEDLKDQKKKIEDIIKKTPKGKFANDIINLVKIVLADESRDDLENVIETNLKKVLFTWQQIDSLIKKDKDLYGIGFAGSTVRVLYYERVSSKINELLGARPATIDNLDKLNNYIDTASEIIKPVPGFISPFIGGASNDLHAQVNDKLLSLKAFIKEARQAREKVNAQTGSAIGNPTTENTKQGPVTIPEVTLEANKIEMECDKLQDLIKMYEAQVQASLELDDTEKENAKNWLIGQAELVKKQLAFFELVPDSVKQKASIKSLKDLNTISERLAKFHKNWLE